MSRIWQVDPNEVPLAKEPWVTDVKRQKWVLEAQGQIEPILLLPNGYPDKGWAWWAEAQIVAARELGWPTILVTDGV